MIKLYDEVHRVSFLNVEKVVRRCLKDTVVAHRWFSLIFLLVFLAGCQSPGTPSIIADEQRLPRQVDGASDRMIAAIEKDFHRRGVRVITIGQDYLISVPSIALFADQSPRIQWQAYDLLNEIACYLRQFRHIGITVTAYTMPYVSHHREHVLTLARASAVSNYLLSQGVETRFIFTEGMGSDKPIVAIARRGDKSPNSRIEITFRELIA
ncbi:MAG: OmpA family protein [Legionellaceae bacterium]